MRRTRNSHWLDRHSQRDLKSLSMVQQVTSMHGLIPTVDATDRW